MQVGTCVPHLPRDVQERMLLLSAGRCQWLYLEQCALLVPAAQHQGGHSCQVGLHPPARVLYTVHVTCSPVMAGYTATRQEHTGCGSLQKGCPPCCLAAAGNDAATLLGWRPLPDSSFVLKLARSAQTTLRQLSCFTNLSNKQNC